LDFLRGAFAVAAGAGLEAAGAGFIVGVREEDKAGFMGGDWAALRKPPVAPVRTNECGRAHNDPATTQLITTNERGKSGVGGKRKRVCDQVRPVRDETRAEGAQDGRPIRRNQGRKSCGHDLTTRARGKSYTSLVMSGRGDG
jgi:hypothetical protein